MNVPPRSGLNNLLKKVSNRFYMAKAGILFYRKLDTVPVVMPDTDIVLREMTCADLPQIESIAGPDKTRLFRRRLQEGKDGLVALHDGRIVHYSWTTFTREYDDWLGVDVPVNTGEAYSYDLYTVPGARGKNIAPAVLSAAMRYMKIRGACRALIIVSIQNRSSLRAVYKLGYRKRQLIIRDFLFGTPFILRTRPLLPTGICNCQHGFIP